MLHGSLLRWSHTGTHVGDFLGIPPTGKAFTFRGIDMYRVRDGKIAEHWNVVDMLGFCQQVGAVPPLRAEGEILPG
jgi:predicted ester cyclase